MKNNFTNEDPNINSGLILPPFDLYNITVNLNKPLIDLDQFKKLCDDTTVSEIINDIYFRGVDSSCYRGSNNFRKLMCEKAKTETSIPYNINIYSYDEVDNNFESMIKLKNHKYLLDLPGDQPWSIRFKFLMMMERVVFRISFYNSEYENGPYKQFHDYLFEPDIDYVNLVYDFKIHEKIPSTILSQINTDIINKYKYFEKNPEKYTEMVNNMKQKSSQLTLANCLIYTEKLINAYTQNLIEPLISGGYTHKRRNKSKSKKRRKIKIKTKRKTIF
jgi:hypothetical protein